MGSDDLFKKRRAARKQRQHEYKTPRANSFLIVTEGERTEPLYFKGLQKLDELFEQYHLGNGKYKKTIKIFIPC